MIKIKHLKLFLFFFSLHFSFNTLALQIKSEKIFDNSRNRKIAITIYKNQTHNKNPTIIISHGYGAKNTEYSSIAKHCVDLQYNVISIQHDLPTDPPLPRKGNLFVKRKAHWDNGVKNIEFVINTLKQTEKNLNLNTVILVGHSNGGDISMMFAYKYPQIV